MCGFLSEDVAAIAEHGLTPVVWTLEQVGWLAGTGARVHVEVETGMGRQGVKPGATLDALLDAMGAAGLVLDGVMTHFCAAEVADRSGRASSGGDLRRRSRRWVRRGAEVGACGEFFVGG